VSIGSIRGRNFKERARFGFFLCSLAFVTWLVLWLAAKFLIVTAPLSRADALVVLSGSSTYIERSRLAADLYYEGRAPLIILTNDNQTGGWSEQEQRNPFFVERTVEELRRNGVPIKSIEVWWQPVNSTYDEAILVRHRAEVKGLKSLLFVTSSYHSRRALWTLRRVFRGHSVEVGLDAVPVGQQSPGTTIWWSTIRGWRQVALEYPKLIYYWFKY
jgi:uncharacterized SAM-binding protein YcdF (DUF218 family)